MTIEKIDDHIKLAQDRLVEQYKDSKNINALISAIVKPIQDAEDAAFKIYTARWLDKAKGVQLDNIGAVVGETRAGRDDEEYRNAIVLRIIINTSAGEADSIIAATKILVNADKVIYEELYPANFSLFIYGPKIKKNMRELIDPLAAAGVGSPLISYSSTDNVLIFNEVVNRTDNLMVSTLTSSGKQLEEFNVNTDDGLQALLVRTEGVQDMIGEGFAEVYENTPFLYVNGEPYDTGGGEFLRVRVSDSPEEHTISEYGGRLSEVVA